MASKLEDRNRSWQILSLKACMSHGVLGKGGFGRLEREREINDIESGGFRPCKH